MNETELHRKLASDMGLIAWAELQRHFARGALIKVASGLDLVEVAMRVANDDAVAVKAWFEAGSIARANDDHARAWQASERMLRAVVVAPWVLVQEIEREDR